MWWLNHHARRFFRIVMKPLDPVLAKKWHTRMRILYLFSGIFAFSYSYYTYRTHQNEIEEFPADQDPTPLHRMTRLKGEPGKVIINRIGWGRRETYEYDNEEYIKQFNERKKLQATEMESLS